MAHDRSCHHDQRLDATQSVGDEREDDQEMEELERVVGLDKRKKKVRSGGMRVGYDLASLRTATWIGSHSR